jgi:hypothetical protein
MPAADATRRSRRTIYHTTYHVKTLNRCKPDQIIAAETGAVARISAPARPIVTSSVMTDIDVEQQKQQHMTVETLLIVDND